MAEEIRTQQSFESAGEWPLTLIEAQRLQTEGMMPAEPRSLPFQNPDDYQHVREKILTLIGNHPQLPYHNAKHTSEVETRFLAMALRSALSPESRQWGGLRALLHDYGHSGSMFRQTSAAPRNDLSNEEFAALRAHTLFSEIFSLEQIIYLQTGILSTSFGQASGEFARPYKPISDSEKLLAFADIAGFVKDFDEWMEENLLVLMEATTENIPQDFTAYIEGRKRFLRYCRDQLEGVQGILEGEYFAELSNALDGALRNLGDVKNVEPYRHVFERIIAAKKNS